MQQHENYPRIACSLIVIQPTRKYKNTHVLSTITRFVVHWAIESRMCRGCFLEFSMGTVKGSTRLEVQKQNTISNDFAFVVRKRCVWTPNLTTRVKQIHQHTEQCSRRTVNTNRSNEDGHKLVSLRNRVVSLNSCSVALGRCRGRSIQGRACGALKATVTLTGNEIVNMQLQLHLIYTEKHNYLVISISTFCVYIHVGNTIKVITPWILQI